MTEPSVKVETREEEIKPGQHVVTQKYVQETVPGQKLKSKEPLDVGSSSSYGATEASYQTTSKSEPSTFRSTTEGGTYDKQQYQTSREEPKTYVTTEVYEPTRGETRGTYGGTSAGSYQTSESMLHGSSESYNKQREYRTTTEGGAMGAAAPMQTLWSLHKKGDPNKPLKLRMGEKYHEFDLRGLDQGNYALIIHTVDRIRYGGGSTPRFVAVDVQVTDRLGDFILRDIYKVYGRHPTSLIEFGVPPSRAPAHMHLHIQCHTPLLGMSVTGKLVKNYERDLARISSEYELDFDLQAMKRVTREDIEYELNRDSPWRKKALDAGMIRPFLYLVAMHPALRHRVADEIDIALSSSKHYGNAHAESWRLIGNKSNGLRRHIKDAWQLEHSDRDLSWHTCIRRAISELYPEQHEERNLQKVVVDDDRRVSSTPFSSQMDGLESDFLIQLSLRHHERLEKISAKNPRYDLIPTIDRISQGLEFRALINNMSDCRLRDPLIHRLLVELIVMSNYEFKKEEEHRNEFRTKTLDREKKVLNKDKHSQHEVSRRIVPEYTYDLNDRNILKGLKQVLKRGYFDPRQKTSKSYHGQDSRDYNGLETMRYSSQLYFPPLSMPSSMESVIDKHVLSDHNDSFSAITRILIYRMILNAFRIDIDKYY